MTTKTTETHVEMEDATSASNPNAKSVQQIKDMTDLMATRFRLMLRLTAAVAVLAKGEKIRYPNGLKIGNQTYFPEGLEVSKKELRQLESQFVKEIKDLPKYFREASKKKKTARANGNNGFSKPIQVSDELRNFFNSVKLGPAYAAQEDAEGNITYVPTGHDLSEYLRKFLDEGVTSSSLLTPLFSLYAQLTNMQLPDEPAFLKASPEMMKHFASIFKKLEAEDKEKLAQKLAEKEEKIKENLAKGKKIDREKELKKVRENVFNPNRFSYSRIPSLVSKCSIPKSSLSEERQEYLKKEEVVNAVKEEQAIVSQTLNHYRAIRDANRPPKKLTKKSVPAPASSTSTSSTASATASAVNVGK